MKITDETRSPEELDEFNVYCNEPSSRFMGLVDVIACTLAFLAFIIWGGVISIVLACQALAKPFRRRRV